MQNRVTLFSPMGNVLSFRHLTGMESLGRAFEYQLVFSTAQPADVSQLFGAWLAIELELPDEKQRYINGIVTRLWDLGRKQSHDFYRATLRPWTWRLSQRSNCRIFQNETIPDILKTIFRNAGRSDVDDRLSRTYSPREYCVQYRETDLDFASRLMEEEGIYYFFDHTKDSHRLVLADSLSAHRSRSGYAEVPYYPEQESARRSRDHLDRWVVRREIGSGSCILNDFDFELPGALLETRHVSTDKKNDPALEIYDYPGRYRATAEGEVYARLRQEELDARRTCAEARGNAAGLAVGDRFRLAGFPREDQNREHLIVESQLELRSGSYEAGDGTADEEGDEERDEERESRENRPYDASFLTIPSDRPFRSARLTSRPMIRGPQTAIVVGKAGEEIWTDQYGRVKLQFHWDRLGSSNEESSCWVRVVQVWAGGQWGGIHIPRIGQEVIVEFLEGDPDRPLVTGRVYNGDSMPPYSLPGNQTQSGIKSRSTKKGTAENYNELLFEDKKGQEQIRLHAERDLNEVVEVDHTVRIGGNERIEIRGNQTVSIQGAPVQGGGQIGCQVSITGDWKVDVSNTISIQAPTSITLTCGGSSVKLEPGRISLVAGDGATLVLDANAALKAKEISADADKEVRLAGAAGTARANSQGVQIQGPVVKLN